MRGEKLTWRSFFFPVRNHIIPGKVRSEPGESSEFGLAGFQEKAMVFKAHYIAGLWCPSLFEFCAAWRTYEPNTVGADQWWLVTIGVEEGTHSSHSH